MTREILILWRLRNERDNPRSWPYTCHGLFIGLVKKWPSGIKQRIDPLWKLLDISVEPSSITDASIEYVGSLVSEEPAQRPADSQFQLIKKSASPKTFFSFSPPRKRPVTLFGRARFGFQESAIQLTEKNILYLKDKPSQEVDDTIEQTLPSQGEVNSELRSCNKPLVKGVEEDANELQCEKPGERESESEKVQPSSSNYYRDESNPKYEMEKKRCIEPEAQMISCSLIRSPKCFSERFRKLYSSMNVAVPQPLPSLVELMNAHKRAKRRVNFSPVN